MFSKPLIITLLLLSVAVSSQVVANDDESKTTTSTRNLLNLPRRNQTACDLIHPERLPKECHCRDPNQYGLVIECMKPFNSTYFNDTIGMKIALDPCNSEGSSLSLDITERDHDIDFTMAGIRAGEEKNIPIPGLAIVIPTFGNFGVDAAVLIFGNLDELTVKVGLNACMGIGMHQVCASSVPGLANIFPWYVLEGTYSFGDYCNSTELLLETPHMAEE